MGAESWVDWSISYSTSYLNPTLKITALILVATAIFIFLFARIKFKEFKDLKYLINLLIVSSILIFLGFFFRLLGDFIILWKWLESTFNFVSAILFMLTALAFIFGIIKSEKVQFNVDLALFILIGGVIFAIIFWSFLSSPSISTSSLNLDYEVSILNYILKLIDTIAFILAFYLFFKGHEKYTEKLGKMIQFLIYVAFFLYLGSICRDHGINLGFNKDLSLKWFQSIFYNIASCLLIYTAYLFYDTGKKFTVALKV